MQAGWKPKKQHQNFYEVNNINFIPPQIDIKHLNDDGRLLSKAQVEAILDLKLKEGRKYKKAEILELIPKDKNIKNLDYAISRVNGEYYAIYLGRKKGKHIGEGASGVVKAAQNIQTGEWVARKVVKSHITINESFALEAMGKLKGSYCQDIHKSEIFMSYEVGKELNDLYSKYLPTTKLLNIALQILIATRALHKKGMLHADIHQYNIICDIIHEKISLIDFGSIMQNVVDPMEFHHEMQDIFYTLTPLFGFNYNCTTRKFSDARAFDNGCKLHLLTTFPDNSVIHHYKNSYILVNNQLYHINDNGKSEKLNITHALYFNIKLNTIQKYDSCTFHRVDAIPEALDNYHNSYLLTKNALYYVDNTGKYLEVELSDFNQFLNKTELAKVQCGATKYLQHGTFKPYITNQIPQVLSLNLKHDDFLEKVTNANLHLDNVALPPKIQNSRLRNELMNFFNDVNPKSKEDDLFSQFEHICKSCTDKTIKIGYINIEEYKNLSQSDKASMIQALKEVDEIHLIENNKKPLNQINYHVIKKDLEQYNLAVYDKVIRYTNNNYLAKALRITPPNTPQRKYERYFMTFTADQSLQNKLSHKKVKLVMVNNPHEEKTFQDTFETSVQSSMTPKAGIEETPFVSLKRFAASISTLFGAQQYRKVSKQEPHLDKRKSVHKTH